MTLQRTEKYQRVGVIMIAPVGVVMLLSDWLGLSEQVYNFVSRVGAILGVGLLSLAVHRRRIKRAGEQAETNS